MTRKKPDGAAKKPSPTSNEKYRKSNKPVRIRPRLAEIAKRAAEALEQDLTQYVNDALRERLERDQLWPPLTDTLPPAAS